MGLWNNTSKMVFEILYVGSINIILCIKGNINQQHKNTNL